jgi:DNA-binding transcriptional LysR family regulator
MKLANLDLFEDVYRHGSFSAVARSRNVAPSVVSRAIAGLEADLGVLLFYRTTRKIAATEAADLLMREVDVHLEALRSLRATLADTADGPSGVLRISASHAFGIHCLGPIVPAFCRAYPDIRIDLSLSDQLVDIVGDRFDVVLRHGPLADSSMIATPVLRTRYHVCASPDYVASAGRPATPADIGNRSCLTFPLPGFSDVWRLRDAAGREQEVPIRSAQSVNSGIVQRAWALQGLGIVLLSDWLIGADLAAGRLIDLFPDHVATPSNFRTVISAVYPNRSYTPKKVKLFIAFLQQMLAAGLASLDDRTPVDR